MGPVRLRRAAGAGEDLVPEELLWTPRSLAGQVLQRHSGGDRPFGFEEQGSFKDPYTFKGTTAQDVVMPLDAFTDQTRPEI